MKIITGRASKDIDAPVLKRIREIKAEDPFAPVIVITMRQATFITEKYMLERLGEKGVFGLEVLSFDKLTQKLNDTVRGRAVKTLDSAGKCMLFCSFLKKYGEDLSSLSKAGKKAETAKGLAELYDEFVSLDITPEDLLTVAGQNNSLSKKLGEIYVAFSRFRDWSSGKDVLTLDRVNMAIESIRDSGYIKAAHVFLIGCDALTEQMIRYIAEIDRYAKSVTVSLLYSEDAGDAGVFDMPKSYLVKLKDMCGAEIEKVTDERQVSPDLRHIERYLFAHPYEKTSSSGDVAIIACENPGREVMACCERVAELIRDGYRPSEIAVVAADINSYAKYIKKYFGASNIPYFLDEKRSLAENALSDFILSALSLIKGRMTADRLIVHIRTGFLGNHAEREIISRVIRERIKNVYKLEHKLENEKEEAARISCVKPVFEFREKVRKAKKQSDIIDMLEEYVSANGAAGILQRMIDEQRMYGFDDSAEYFEQIGDKISEVFSQLRIIADGNADPELLSDMLESAFAAHSVSIIPVKSEAVFFGDVNSSKVHSVKCLMILGVNEGRIPDYEEAAGILSYSEKDAVLRKVKDQGYPSALTKQKLCIYEIVTAPTDRIEFYYHNADDKDVTPESVLIVKMRDMFDKDGHADKRDVDIIGRSLLSNAVESAKSSVGRILLGIDTESDRKAIGDLLTDPVAGKRIADFCRLGRAEVHETISPDTAARIYPPEGSVTLFEDFFKCPYFFFLNRGISPKERKRPDIEHDETGTIMHDLFDGFFKVIKNSNLSIKDIDAERITEILDGNADAAVKKINKDLDDGEGRAFVEQLKHEVAEYLALLKREKETSSGDVLLTEERFSENIAGNDVKGCIDRIDTCVVNGQEFFTVTDYKTGSPKKFSLKDLYAGLSLQIAVYILAAKKLLPGSKPAGAGYLSVNPNNMGEKEGYPPFSAEGLYLKNFGVIRSVFGKIVAPDGTTKIPELNIPLKGSEENGDERFDGRSTGKLITEHDLDVITDFAALKVAEASERIRSGEIRDLPVVDSEGECHCKYCPYASLCNGAVFDKGTPPAGGKNDIISKMEKEVNGSDRTD